MRSAKEQGWFPYGATTVCCFEVWGDGRIQQVERTKSSMCESYERVKSGETKMYAVWPGQWRSDLFIIDDIEEWAKKNKII